MSTSHLAGRRGVGPTLAVVALAAALAACGSLSTYKPKGPGESSGYTDERLAENRYRITYAGTTATRRETVENFLLRRSAEVTLHAGYRHFVFDTRDTEAKTYYRSDFDYGPYYGWYWRSWPWAPGWPYPPRWRESETIPVTRYTAYAEIVLLPEADAAKEPRALDAADLLTRLAPPQAK